MAWQGTGETHEVRPAHKFNPVLTGDGRRILRKMLMSSPADHVGRCDDIAALIVAYRDSVVAIKALRRQFNLHVRTARAHLARSGVVLRAQRVLTESQRIEVIDLYATGASLLQLGHKFGVANNSIRNCLLEQGVELRPVRRLPR